VIIRTRWPYEDGAAFYEIWWEVAKESVCVQDEKPREQPGSHVTGTNS